MPAEIVTDDHSVATHVAGRIGAIADPGPLGLFGFALTTFMLSVFNANWFGDKDSGLVLVVLPMALFYGGLAQLLAGMWEFKKANTFGALAFTSYGAFWLSFAAYIKFVAGGLGPDEYKATGLYLLSWTIFTVIMLVASLRVSAAVMLVFLALSLTFLFLTIGAFDQSTSWTHLGGWFGLVTALFAAYAAGAGVINATWGRTVLPVMPLVRS